MAVIFSQSLIIFIWVLRNKKIPVGSVNAASDEDFFIINKCQGAKDCFLQSLIALIFEKIILRFINNVLYYNKTYNSSNIDSKVLFLLSVFILLSSI